MYAPSIATPAIEDPLWRVGILSGYRLRVSTTSAAKGFNEFRSLIWNASSQWFPVLPRRRRNSPYAARIFSSVISVDAMYKYQSSESAGLIPNAAAKEGLVATVARTLHTYTNTVNILCEAFRVEFDSSGSSLSDSLITVLPIGETRKTPRKGAQIAGVNLICKSPVSAGNLNGRGMIGSGIMSWGTPDVVSNPDVWSQFICWKSGCPVRLQRLNA